MDKPTKLAFSDEATFRFSRAEILIPIIMVTSVFIAVLVTGATLAELVLPLIAVSGIASIVIGLFGSVSLGHRISENFQINRMFSGEIWECWQFSSSEWQTEVESVCNLISPKDDGENAYSGVIASSIFGFVIAVILYVITFFAFKEPEIKIAMRYVAVGLFFLMVGVGYFQPKVAKKEADRYRRKALRIREPRVWFGPDGVYHETLGHTSLKELYKVTDQTKSRNRIQFTLVVTSADSDDVVKYRTPVPSGCKERAGDLVRRYRQERLLT